MNADLNFNFISLVIRIGALLYLFSLLFSKVPRLKDRLGNKVTIILRLCLYLVAYIALTSRNLDGSNAYYGLRLPDKNGWILTALLVTFFVIGSYFQAGRESVQKGMPYLKFSRWNFMTYLTNSVTWILYLLGYEFLMRGLLLAESLNRLGIIGAIALNIVVYVAVHLPKTKLEIFGSIPVGLLLCIVTIQTGSIVPAVATHSAMAISVEAFVLYHAKKREKMQFAG